MGFVLFTYLYIYLFIYYSFYFYRHFLLPCLHAFKHQQHGNQDDQERKPVPTGSPHSAETKEHHGKLQQVHAGILGLEKAIVAAIES